MIVSAEFEPAPGLPLSSCRVSARHEPALAPTRTSAYRRLLLGVLAINAAVLVVNARGHDWRLADGSALAACADLTLVDVAVAVVVRQQVVLNALYGLAGRGSSSWPLWIRWSISKVHHVGGIHAGSAIAGTAWLWAFATAAAVTRIRHPEIVAPTTLGLAVAIALVLAVVTVG